MVRRSKCYLTPCCFHWFFSSYNPPSNITLDLGLFNMPAVWFGAGILFVVGGYRAARRAANIPPVTVVRETEMPTKWRSPLRAAIGVPACGGIFFIPVRSSGSIARRIFRLCDDGAAFCDQHLRRCISLAVNCGVETIK